MHYLKDEERSFVRDLKVADILREYKMGELKGITKNGGVAFFCGDGDIDVRNYHEKTISRRPHGQSLFGGVLIYSRFYRGYKGSFAADSIENALLGLNAKETKTAFLYPHYPCGMATYFEHTIEEVFLMAADTHLRFISEFGFTPDKTHSFFHVKRLNKGAREEQNTYIFDVKKYLALIGAPIITLGQAYILKLAA
ncbi:MAG: hypothetical protein P4L62_01690 [Candidatus Pacebacteria bacterium]|nr:hypothetical protein [Candidatus Paceibacterota bacterium]MDR3583048.1 hypothetical protein [Candidatus Paceibacterota bacterium]